jgi:hypothetical protein
MFKNVKSNPGTATENPGSSRQLHITEDFT